MPLKLFFIFFFPLWLFRQFKAILFWLYLWQLKEYRLDRFLDHFRTEKGKRLIFDPIQFFKGFLIFLFSFPLFVILITFFLYLSELFIFFRNLFFQKLLKPVFTPKMIFLIAVSFLFAIFYFFSFFQEKFYFIFHLLFFDIFLPLIISGIVLVFQPLNFFYKKLLLKRAREKIKRFRNLLVIGIAGSYGKTSTKEFLATILSEKFNVLKTKGHQNTDIGISKCILNDLTSEHQIFVVEMGAYKKGEIKLLAEMTRPKIGILTGVNEQHLALFGSMENLLSAEGGKELIECLPEDGFVIFNGNNEICQEIYRQTKKDKRICKNFYNLDSKHGFFDLWAEEIKVEKYSLSFTVFSEDGERADFKVNLIGAQNIENILLAATCAKELGMNLREIASACEKIRPEAGGIVAKKGIDGLNIIDSTYSANPNGVIAHLEYLKVWPGKKIIVMPCLIELGKAALEVHKRIGREIAKVCQLAIITTKDKFKELQEEAIKNGMKKENILFEERPKEIFKKIKEFSQPGDVILLEGRLSNQLINLFTVKN